MHRQFRAQYFWRVPAETSRWTTVSGVQCWFVSHRQGQSIAIQVLKDVYNIDASQARSKSWEEFKDVEFDFVVTVCDNARETCPIWPGQPIVAHWGSPDPAAVEGTEAEKYRAFKEVAFQINRRLQLFTSLPLDKLDRLKLAAATREIGSRE